MKHFKPKLLFLLLISLALPDSARAADGCATRNLQGILRQLPDIDISAYEPDKTYIVENQKHTIIIRTNQWNEVAHVGLKVIPDTLLEQYGIVGEFVGRYLLELSLLPADQVAAKMRNDDVYFENGTCQQFLGLTSPDAVTLECVDFRSYRITWKEKGRKRAMLFPMDYQLLSGCDLIELEHNYLRDLQRYPETFRPPYLPNEWLNATYSRKEGATFIAPDIRNELYFSNINEKQELVCDMLHPEWSARNIALSANAVGKDKESFMLELTLDRYDYDSSVLKIPMCQLVAFNEDERCVPFFQMKERNDDVLKGVVYFTNSKGGYCHLLYLEIPTDAIRQRGGTLKGRLFAYIPSHNVDKDYFN